MKIKESLAERIFDLVNILIMLVVIVVTVYPLLYVIFASFSETALLMSHQGPLLKPLGFSTNAYKMVKNYPMFARSYVNTIIIVVVGVCINIVLTALGAYVLSRKQLYFKKYIMVFITLTMFFSGGLIPFYLTVKGLHIDNTLWAVILPAAINTFNLIIMRTSFESLPDSLEEAAMIDGAKHLTVLTRIVLPLSKATIAVMVLYYAVGHWNSWFNAMLFIRKRELYPLQLILREILIQNDTNAVTAGEALSDQEAIGETVRYAIVVVATIPILILYPFLQKYFAKGVMVGAVKG